MILKMTVVRAVARVSARIQPSLRDYCLNNATEYYNQNLCYNITSFLLSPLILESNKVGNMDMATLILKLKTEKPTSFKGNVLTTT